MKKDVGLGLAVFSAATFGTSGSFATSLLRAGWTPGAAVTARIVIAAVVLTVPALLQLRGRRQQLRRHARSITAYGVVAVAAAQICYFSAVQRLSVAVALLLEYCGILLVMAWLWVRHGRRPGRLAVAGAITALAGLAGVLDLAGHHHLDPVGLLWACGAAVGLAVYFVMAARDDDDTLPPLVVAWGGLATGGVVMVAAALVGAVPIRAPRTTVVLAHANVSWLVPVAGLSLVAAVIAYVAGIAAARVLGATLASFLGLTEVLFAVVFAWLLLGESLTGVQLVGGVFVVAGIALVRLQEVRTSRRAGVRPGGGVASPGPQGTDERVAVLQHDAS
jgi:drug/metabolite transporter (DMT)-like permease